MIDELNGYLQRLRKAVADIGKKTAGKLLWGYGWCKDSDDLELIELKHAIELLRNQALSGGICICEDELGHIKSRINKLLGPVCGDEPKDFTRADNPDTAWILNNPDCVAYDFMADFLAAQCKKVGIDFSIIQRDCSTVGLDLKTSNLITCDAINLALELEEKSCDIDLDVKLDIQKCVEDVTLVLTPLNCGIDLKTYVTLLNCGFTLETILEQLNCGATVQTLLTNVDSCFTEEEAVAFLPLVFNVSADDTTVCYYTDVTLSLDVLHPDATYTWDFGTGSTPASGTGFGPHTIQYTSSGVKTVTVTGTAGAQVTVDTVQITVSTCPANITGTVVDGFGFPLQSANIKLFNDTNGDGISDGGAAVRSVFSTVTGTWSMAVVTPGYYIVELTSPTNWTITSGFNEGLNPGPATNLNDLPDADSTDGVLPITLVPNVTDGHVHFIVTPNDGTITGNVQDILANPIVGATINIYADANLDGVAEGLVLYSGVTDISGNYSISGINVATGDHSGTTANTAYGNYVIELVVPLGYTIVSGIDASNDADIVPNTVTTDNIIPCTLTPGEVDANNNFIIQV